MMARIQFWRLMGFISKGGQGPAFEIRSELSASSTLRAWTLKRLVASVSEAQYI